MRRTQDIDCAVCNSFEAGLTVVFAAQGRGKPREGPKIGDGNIREQQVRWRDAARSRGALAPWPRGSGPVPVPSSPGGSGWQRRFPRPAQGRAQSPSLRRVQPAGLNSKPARRFACCRHSIAHQSFIFGVRNDCQSLRSGIGQYARSITPESAIWLRPVATARAPARTIKHIRPVRASSSGRGSQRMHPEIGFSRQCRPLNQARIIKGGRKIGHQCHTRDPARDAGGLVDRKDAQIDNTGGKVCALRRLFPHRQVPSRQSGPWRRTGCRSGCPRQGQRGPRLQGQGRRSCCNSMAARQHIKTRHSDGHAHFNLLGNDRAVDVICHIAGNLHAPIHRLGCMTSASAARFSRSVGQAVQGMIFARRGRKRRPSVLVMPTLGRIGCCTCLMRSSKLPRRPSRRFTQSWAALFDYKHRIRTDFKFYSQDLINTLFMHPYTKIEFIQHDLKVSRPTATKYLMRSPKAASCRNKAWTQQLLHQCCAQQHSVGQPMMTGLTNSNKKRSVAGGNRLLPCLRL